MGLIDKTVYCAVGIAIGCYVLATVNLNDVSNMRIGDVVNAEIIGQNVQLLTSWTTQFLRNLSSGGTGGNEGASS